MPPIRGREKNMAIRKIDALPNGKRAVATLNGEVRYIDPDWAVPLQDVGLARDNDWSALTPGMPVSESSITNCYRIRLDDGRSFFFKRYVYPPAKQKRYWMRASKAQVEVFGYAQLRKIGIPTLNVIGFGECRSLGALQAAYIITEGIPDSMNLEQFAHDVWFDLPRNQRSKIYVQLKRLIFAQLNTAHASKFFHQDLHWRNILVTGQHGEYQSIWIDCPRSAYRKLPMAARHGQMVDLSCLARKSLSYISRGERYHALNEYLALNNLGWDNRDLFREIAAHHKRSPNPPVLLDIPGEEKQCRT